MQRDPVGPQELIDQVYYLFCSIQARNYSFKQLALLQHADADIRQIVLLLQGYSKKEHSSCGGYNSTRRSTSQEERKVGSSTPLGRTLDHPP